MNDEIFDKLLTTFSHEELAGMYTVISKREVQYLKEIKILRLSLQSHGQIVDMNYDLREQLKELKGACFHCEEVALTNVKLEAENEKLRDQIMALSKMALERSERNEF